MRSMHCRACLQNHVPKTYTRSSLSTEAGLWLAGVAVGWAVGAWRAIAGSSGGAPTAEIQDRMLSTLSTSFAAPTAAAEAAPGTDNILLHIAGWLSDTSWEFIRNFWWALLIPLAFSLWRQFTKYEGCRACGSRDLEPAEVPGD
jgi:hypothetical protein